MKRVLSLLCALALSGALTAADRVALVIGNSKYANLPPTMQLTSPVADASDVAAAVKALGYTIVTGSAVKDASRDGILTSIEAFIQAAKGAEAAVFYFSGHGVQVGEDNYLLASDTPKLTGMSVLKGRAVLLRDLVMVGLEEAGAKNKAIILDCCRDNPFAAQLDTALASVGKSIKTKSVGEISGYGPGFYLAFATSPGLVASDGNGRRNSPFTAALLKSLPGGAGKDIELFFRDVKMLLGDEQVSWTNNSLRTTFTLARVTVAKEDAKSAPEMSQAEIKRQIAEGVAAELARRQAMTPSVTLSTPEPKAGATMTVELPGGEKMTFCYCPPGTFTMGSPTSEQDRKSDERQISVRIKSGFWLAKTECTQGQWVAVMGSNPSTVTGCLRLPVETTSQTDALAYAQKLNALVNLPQGLKLTLPTEAQWEYACRAGTVTAFAFGDKLDVEAANYFPPEAHGKYSSRLTVNVGSYPSNAWGLQDMHGNVCEWVLNGYTIVPSSDANEKGSAEHAVYRGGCYFDQSKGCRSAHRGPRPRAKGEEYTGFRLALVQEN